MVVVLERGEQVPLAAEEMSRLEAVEWNRETVAVVLLAEGARSGKGKLPSWSGGLLAALVGRIDCASEMAMVR